MLFLINLFIASLWLSVTFRVVKTMLYVLHKILDLQGIVCSIKTRVAPLCVTNDVADDESNGA